MNTVVKTKRKSEQLLWGKWNISHFLVLVVKGTKANSSNFYRRWHEPSWTGKENDETFGTRVSGIAVRPAWPSLTTADMRGGILRCIRDARSTGDSFTSTGDSPVAIDRSGSRLLPIFEGSRINVLNLSDDVRKKQLKSGFALNMKKTVHIEGEVYESDIFVRH